MMQWKKHDQKQGFSFDNKGGINLNGKGITNKVSNAFDVNEYVRQEFRYNAFLPAINIAAK